MKRLAVFVLVVVLGACATPATGAGGKKLILATTTLFADMAANVGGDRVKADSIVPAGSHVEEFEPKPEDSKKVAQADLIIKNGLDLDDPWADPLLRDKKRDTPVVTLTADARRSSSPADRGHGWTSSAAVRPFARALALSSSDG